METFWTGGIVVVAITQVLAFILIIAFARELGVILVRLGPVTARPTPDGPTIGERIEALELSDLHGRTYNISACKTERLLVFVSPTCPGCDELLPGLRTLGAEFGVTPRVFAISSKEGTPGDFDYAKRLAPHVPYICDPGLHDRFGVHTSPYAVLLDHDNVVKAKGVANNLQHLESLFSLETYVETHDHSEHQEVVVIDGERSNGH
ncbi:MAG: hypothetical protein IH957_10345 [Chloroflexi bacterium]|nr:hypothetical protein [Chloroflexota bacterium]